MRNTRITILMVVAVLFMAAGQGFGWTQYNAYSEFSLVQGGTSGTWFYQEFDGSATFTNLVMNPNGTIFSNLLYNSTPCWTVADSELPTLFKDSVTTDGIVFHPGLPNDYQQLSRHDIVLRWVAPVSGNYDITGFVRGDARFGVGGDGFEFSVFKGNISLLTLDISCNDKMNHSISLSGLVIQAGDSLTFQAFDNGNNTFDPGVYDFTITQVPEPATLVLLGLGGLVLRRKK